MATTVAPAHEPATESVGSSPPGLRAGAIGFASNVAIGVASTAPAYSLAATLGLLVAVAGVGTHAPAVLLVSFVPMFCISVAYRALNRADPDCGTSFAWVTRALGPRLGWTTGFAIFAADVIVMATLSEIAGKYLFILVGWHSAASSTLGLAVAATMFIALMTWVAYRGVELSARVQQALLALELTILAVFSVVALVKVYANGPVGSIHPSLGWLNPFALSLGSLVDGVLLGVFVYWGWDACVTVNEESQDARRGPGKAAVVSTLILLVTFVLIAFYYGLTGLACAVYYRRRLGAGVRQLVGLGVVPLLGALLLAGIFAKAYAHYSQHEIGGALVNYAAPVAGIEIPIVIGIGSLGLGLALALWLGAGRAFSPYFGRRREALGPLTTEDIDA